MILMKTCNKCYKTLSIDNFHNDKSLKDGKRNMCKECAKKVTKKWLKEHPFEVKVYHDRYYRENKEFCLTRNNNYYNKNREFCISLSKNWYKRNKDKIKKKIRDENNEITSNTPI